MLMHWPLAPLTTSFMLNLCNGLLQLRIWKFPLAVLGISEWTSLPQQIQARLQRYCWQCHFIDVLTAMQISCQGQNWCLWHQNKKFQVVLTINAWSLQCAELSKFWLMKGCAQNVFKLIKLFDNYWMTYICELALYSVEKWRFSNFTLNIYFVKIQSVHYC